MNGASTEEGDHILCATSDEDRDEWVRVLNSWVTGSYIEAPPLEPAQPSQSQSQSLAAAHPVAARKASLNAIAQHQSAESPHRRQTSADQQTNGMMPPPPEHRAHKRAQFAGDTMSPSSSLPLDLADLARPPPIHANEAMRSSSSLGHHSDTAARHAFFAPHGRAQSSDPNALPRAPSPERTTRDPTPSSSLRTAKISGPTNAVPIGNANFKAQPPSSQQQQSASTPPTSSSSLPPPMSAASQSREALVGTPASGSGSGGRRDHEERRQRVKSSFWTFASRSHPDRGQPAQPVAQASPVFGVPLADAVAVASVKEGFMVPAVVFRCVEYLTEKDATREEGIYRVSGGTMVIKALKEKFNAGASILELAYELTRARRRRLQPPRLGRVL